MFFRVVGGDAAPFGEIQMENTNRINKVNTVHSNEQEAMPEVNRNRVTNDRNTTIPLNGSSKWIWTGRESGDVAIFANFESSGGENRPKNMAVKVWRRTS